MSWSDASQSRGGAPSPVQAQPGARAAVTAGPAPYRKGDDTVQCPQCLLYNSPDAHYCDQCAAFLSAVPRPKLDNPREFLHCTGCAASNMPDALYCDQCGRKFPPAAYEAALAAKQAVGDANLAAAATSSSGRRPEGAGMTPAERRAYLDARALQQERQLALALAPVSGDPLCDAAAAYDRAGEIQALWEALDDEARRQRAELGSWPDPAAVAACRQAEADAEAAWQARQAAVAQRDRLNDQLTGRTPEQDEYEAERFEAIYRSKRHERWERKPDVSDRRPW